MNEHRRPPLPPEQPNGLDEPIPSTGAGAAPPRPSPPLPPPERPPAPPAAPPAVPEYHRASDPMAKSPGLALFLSIFFPGLGHIYVGAYERAMMIVAGIGVSIWAMVVSEGRLWPLAFAITFAYFYAIFDAYREAQIANLADDQELPRPRRRAEGRLVFGVFLTVVASLVLADRLGLFDIRWLYDWWPVIILVVGLYLIGSWIWERVASSRRNEDENLD
jgi:hypothetical protein